MSCTNKRHILEIDELSVSFLQYENNRSSRQIELPVISKLSVSVHEGEIVAVVGSSGSGKSLLAHAILDMLPYNARIGGRMYFDGELLTPEKIREYRGSRIAFVPQSTTYLDPLMKVGEQVRGGRNGSDGENFKRGSRPVRGGRNDSDGENFKRGSRPVRSRRNDPERRKKQRSLFARYGLNEETDTKYPFECSGGMTRRVLLTSALMGNPELIIADEPTPGMDLALAKKSMEDFRTFADEGNGVLLITHDIELALEVADRIAVFYAGTTIEEAPVTDFASEKLLRHPYTRALWRAMPQNGFQPLPGTQPYVKDMPAGCPFGPRCENYSQECAGEIPMQRVGCGTVRCVKYHGEPLAVQAHAHV